MDVEKLLELILSAHEGIWKWAVMVDPGDGEPMKVVTNATWNADGKALILEID